MNVKHVLDGTFANSLRVENPKMELKLLVLYTLYNFMKPP